MDWPPVGCIGAARHAATVVTTDPLPRRATTTAQRNESLKNGLRHRQRARSRQVRNAIRAGGYDIEDNIAKRLSTRRSTTACLRHYLFPSADHTQPQRNKWLLIKAAGGAYDLLTEGPVAAKINFMKAGAKKEDVPVVNCKNVPDRNKKLGC